MSPLAELQQAFHGAILRGAPTKIAVTGNLSLAEALSVHRNTALGGLVNALRLTHPTVDALVGEDYFDQVARDYVLAQPPRSASLDSYGATFADYLEGVPSLRDFAYLGDVARLDRTIDTTLRCTRATKAIAIDAQVAIRLPLSLTILDLTYPAHVIRNCLEDDTALSPLCLEQGAHHIAIWRKNDAAAIFAIRTPAARFVRALLEGAAPDVAIEAAGRNPSETLPIIQADIFAAPFCAVTPLMEDAQ